MIEILKKAADGQALSAQESEAILAYSDFVQKHLVLVEAKYERAQAAAKCLELLECRPSLQCIGPEIEADEEEVDDEVEEEDEEPDEDSSIDSEPISMEQVDPDGLPVYEVGKAPAETISRPELQESVGYTSSAFTRYLRNHPEHPKPVGRVRQLGGGVPVALFNRCAVNTYWQCREN